MGFTHVSCVVNILCNDPLHKSLFICLVLCMCCATLLYKIFFSLINSVLHNITNFMTCGSYLIRYTPYIHYA
jgi:hypothetical protein